MVVTGREGQVVTALVERSAMEDRFEVIPLGRPALDLTRPDTLDAVLEASRPDVIVSAAAYTAVDQAETQEDIATLVNGIAAGAIAKAAERLHVPIIHLSTDYVFDGMKLSPYTETDPVNPAGAYGRSKLAGEKAVAVATCNHVILRTAWVYSPFGKNFVRTMLKLAESRDSLNVVSDQFGNPTSALDIADGIFAIAAKMLDSNAMELRGLFHMSGQGEASWAEFAAEVFRCSESAGGPGSLVEPIPSIAYPTPAKRPANSRLDCRKLFKAYEVQLPSWRLSTAQIVERLV